MSRNIRQKFPRPPVKANKRRGSDTSSSLNLSDEDGYSAVEEVSDSEDDDEEGVYAAEAEHIINREVRKQRTSSSPRPNRDDDEDADEEDDDGTDGEDEDDAGLNDDDDDTGGVWNGIESGSEDEVGSETLADTLTPVGRRVRFAGVPDSDTDSTTTEDISDFFPDLFVEQTSLDPAFRREVEQDDVSSNGSYWDFRDGVGGSGGVSMRLVGIADDGDTPTATPGNQETSELSDEDSELDGYETDGDTTDDEEDPEPIVRRKQPRPSQPTDGTSDSETDRPVKFRRARPRSVRFDLTTADNKPIAVMHPKTGKMIIFTPEKSRGFGLSPETFREMDFFSSSHMIQSSPILSHSGSLMFGAMLSSNTLGDLVQPQHFGPVEAFFPNWNGDGILIDESDSSVLFDGDDEDERKLTLDDFINFGNDSDADNPTQDAETPNWEDDVTTEAASTPGRRPSTATSAMSDSQMDMHPLLAHFDSNPDAAGAFRRNQIDQQLIFSDRATQDSLAFSSPYSIGTLRGIKEGSLQTAAATPITPVRRHRRSISGLNDFTRSPLESISQKRKASAGIGLSEESHKRHRSISDVRNIAL